MTVERINSYRDPRVWRDSMDLAEMMYRVTDGFPRRETYGLASQLRRAAVSVPSDVAEGHTRERTGEYLQYISVAQGSLSEMETQTELAGRFGYVPQQRLDGILGRTAALRRQLYALRNALKERIAGGSAPGSDPSPAPGP